jgi:hypothetical protein
VEKWGQAPPSLSESNHPQAEEIGVEIGVMEISVSSFFSPFLRRLLERSTSL